MVDKLEICANIGLMILVVIAACATVNYGIDILVKIVGH